MQEMQPKISVVMPVLNRRETIEKAILSVIQQNCADVEFIIIDGGSTDGTVEIIKKYAEHLAYWHSKKDGSSAVASNLGIAQARGDYVGLLMADDWYEPDTFAQLRAAQLQQKADLFTFGSRVVEWNAKAAQYKVLQLHATAKDLELTFYNICFAHSAICCRFISRDFYQRIGVFAPFNANGEHVFSNDKEFLLRVILNNAKNIFINYLAYNYLAHAGSPSFNNSRQSIMRLCQEHMEIAAVFPHKNTLSFSQKWFLKYWYNEQSVRLVLYYILERQFGALRNLMKKEIKRLNLLWPIICAYTLIHIVIKRSLRLIFTGKVTRSI